MPRLPKPDEKTDPEFSSVVKELVASRGNISNIQRAMGHAPEGLRRFSHLGDYIRYRSSLSPKLREIVIVASGRNSSYALFHHAPLALQAGVTEAELHALREGQVPASFNAVERAVVRYVYEFLTPQSVGDSAFKELASQVTPRELSDVSFTAAYYSAVLLMGSALGVTHEDEAFLAHEVKWQQARDRKTA
jgi:4-carboxymuconolactone decarboxylase